MCGGYEKNVKEIKTESNFTNYFDLFFLIFFLKFR